MKKFFIAFIMLFMPVAVFAGGDGYYYDDSNETYVVQCSYSNKQSNGTAKIEIHYYHNTSSDDYDKWGIAYQEAGGSYRQNGMNKGPDWFGNIFSSDGSPNIYISDEVYNALKDNHTCPGICYLDTIARNEICCDNKDGWCTKNHTDAGTAFGEKNDKFESGKKESDKQKDVADKIEINMNNGITDDMIEEGKEAVQGQINENIDKVLEEEYGTDKGGEVSDEDKNYYQDHKDDITDDPQKNLTNRVNELENLLEQDYENGLIGEDTYNEKKQIFENFTDEDINNLYDNVFDYNLAINPVILDQTCKSMLGDPQTEGTPAFYLIIAFTVMKYVSIILLIVLTIMDFATATASHDNDMIKKATSKAIKRALLCFGIFLLPTLIEFVLKYINERAVGLCGIK